MTTARQKSGKVFYGWWVVLTAGVGLALHFGPIIVPTFGVFLKPLSQEFGWSRTQISLAFSLSTLGVTLTVPFIGRLVDRFGAHKVIVPAVLFLGLSVLSLFFLSAHLWHFYAVYLLMGVVGSGTTPVPYAKVISRWFDRKARLGLGAVRGCSGIERVTHAFSGASPHCWGGLAPRLRTPWSHGHGSCHPRGRTAAQGDATADGTRA
jgi:MFS family permease